MGIHTDLPPVFSEGEQTKITIMKMISENNTMSKHLNVFSVSPESISSLVICRLNEQIFLKTGLLKKYQDILNENEKKMYI